MFGKRANFILLQRFLVTILSSKYYRATDRYRTTLSPPKLNQEGCKRGRIQHRTFFFETKRKLGGNTTVTGPLRSEQQIALLGFRLLRSAQRKGGEGAGIPGGCSAPAKGRATAWPMASAFAQQSPDSPPGKEDQGRRDREMGRGGGERQKDGPGLNGPAISHVPAEHVMRTSFTCVLFRTEWRLTGANEGLQRLFYPSAYLPCGLNHGGCAGAWLWPWVALLIFFVKHARPWLREHGKKRYYFFLKHAWPWAWKKYGISFSEACMTMSLSSTARRSISSFHIFSTAGPFLKSRNSSHMNPQISQAEIPTLIQLEKDEPEASPAA